MNTSNSKPQGISKLVIVGNGFDLAHDLKTSYKHFIDDFWARIHDRADKYSQLGIIAFDPLFKHIISSAQRPITCYADFKSVLINYKSYPHPYKLITTPLALRQGLNDVFVLKNKLFQAICEEAITNWVDIEQIYYSYLKAIAKSDPNRIYKTVTELNNDFQSIIHALHCYLQVSIEEKHDFTKICTPQNQILDLFVQNFLGLEKNPFHEHFLEFNENMHSRLVEFDNYINSLDLNIESDITHETLFIDFNYTPTIEYYVRMINKDRRKFKTRARFVKIHGDLNNSENPINFGFGDEMDEDYKVIENKGQNAYLKYFKSFSYLNNNDYRTLLNWIDTRDFQVFIMGHSCGLSDRTLLNTIFEHKNCHSIKFFYHLRADDSDNFIDTIQNISRHFSDKSKMRSRIVSRSSSRFLSQNVRFCLKNKP